MLKHNLQAAVSIQEVSYRYRSTVALNNLSFKVMPGEVFGILGPNGGGKTTLFRLLSTLMPLQEGKVEVFGHDLQRVPAAVRNHLGVVFQSASLDKKLTVAENMACQAALYGLHGKSARVREQALLEQLGVADRSKDLAEELSGGLRRRVELAKAMLHRPQLLLLDEPSTGLDPGARSDLWKYLFQLRSSLGTTILLTTHLLEEAERADRIAILN
jgi:ABC-2 type transport system ATP-binding protein